MERCPLMQYTMEQDEIYQTIFRKFDLQSKAIETQWEILPRTFLALFHDAFTTGVGHACMTIMSILDPILTEKILSRMDNKELPKKISKLEAKVAYFLLELPKEKLKGRLEVAIVEEYTEKQIATYMSEFTELLNYCENCTETPSLPQEEVMKPYFERFYNYGVDHILQLIYWNLIIPPIENAECECSFCRSRRGEDVLDFSSFDIVKT